MTTTYTAAAVFGRIMNVVQVVLGKWSLFGIARSALASKANKGLLNKKCVDCAEKLSEARAALIARADSSVSSLIELQIL
jgi:hypothetical protein